MIITKMKPLLFTNDTEKVISTHTTNVCVYMGFTVFIILIFIGNISHLTHRLSRDAMVAHFPRHPLQPSLSLGSAVALSQEDIRVTSSPHRVPLKGFQNSQNLLP